MSSPCGNCKSYPCACPLPEIKAGRYTFAPYDNPAHQTSNYCQVCFCTPCICNEENTGFAYCIGCSTKPCICPAAGSDECYCGVCSDCNVWVDDAAAVPGTTPEAVCFSCGHYETKCICPAASTNECYCGLCSDCSVWVDDPADVPIPEVCFSCGHYETKCICHEVFPGVEPKEFEELSEEEPRELHEIEEVALDNWVHRSVNMRCATCMWWVSKTNFEDEMLADLGRCRKNAPTLDGWPAVYETDWCGDHKIDETKI